RSDSFWRERSRPIPQLPANRSQHRRQRQEIHSDLPPPAREPRHRREAAARSCGSQVRPFQSPLTCRTARWGFRCIIDAEALPSLQAPFSLSPIPVSAALAYFLPTQERTVFSQRASFALARLSRDRAPPGRPTQEVAAVE